MVGEKGAAEVGEDDDVGGEGGVCKVRRGEGAMLCDLQTEGRLGYVSAASRRAIALAQAIT